MQSKREKLFQTSLVQENILDRKINNKLTLRKQKLDDIWTSKRLKQSEDQFEMNLDKHSETQNKMIISQNELDFYFKLLQENDFPDKLKGVIGIRKSTTKNDNSIIRGIIERNPIPLLLEILNHYADENLIYEILFIFINMTSLPDVKMPSFVLLENGIVSLLEKIYLCFPSKKIVDQIVWLIGNMTPDSVHIRKEMVNSSFFDYLVKILTSKDYSDFRIDTLRSISSLVEGVGELKNNKSCYILVSYLSKIIRLFRENKIFCDNILNNKFTNEDENHFLYMRYALEIIQKLTDINMSSLAAIIKNNCVKSLVEFLDFVPHEIVQCCILKIIGNFTFAQDELTEIILHYGTLERLASLLDTTNTTRIKKEICWIISNIAAGKEQHVNLIFENEITNMLIEIVSFFDQQPFSVRKEALWCLANLTNTTKPNNITRLVNADLISTFSEYLCTENQNDLITICLEALLNLLAFSKENFCPNDLKRIINRHAYESNLKSKLENLISKPGTNNNIIAKSETILFRFLNDEETTDDDIYYDENIQQEDFTSQMSVNFFMNNENINPYLDDNVCETSPSNNEDFSNTSRIHMEISLNMSQDKLENN